MRIVVTGGTGFIGSSLVRALADRGDECVVVSRGGAHPGDRPEISVVRGDPTAPGDWQDTIDGADAVVNLAGAPIIDPKRRWSAARKRLLKQSRVDATRNVVAAIRSARRPPRVLLSSSAIGYYGPRGADVVDEADPAGDDFLASLCWEWEHGALEADDLARVVLLRTGMVLGRGGGVLSALLPMFKIGLGGPWGSGNQWWSWIHMADEIGLILHAMDHEIAGPVNLTAPNPVTVSAFASALGKVLGKPAVLAAPAFALRIGLGEAAKALLDLQRVVPRRALGSGFTFAFPQLDRALEDLLVAGDEREATQH